MRNNGISDNFFVLWNKKKTIWSKKNLMNPFIVFKYLKSIFTTFKLESIIND